MDPSTREIVTVVIDGIKTSVGKGTTIIEAARGLGIEIPHYCYDPDLSIVASCRLCLVEIEKVPKLQPSCSTPVNEGQIIFTHSDKVLDARRQQMEFLLVQHPLDCPVCDQGGECKLQEYSLKHGFEDTRFRFPKRVLPKPDIGPFIDLERNRCILCSRCVRFMDEIAGEAEFVLVGRGNGTHISTFQDQPLKNEFAGNTIDLCPVGALTSKITRFRTRVWELKNTASICSLCSVGCNVLIQHRNRTHEVLRLVPSYNAVVNGRWLCDIGRFGFDQFNSPERAREPMLKKEGGDTEPVSWATAVQHIIERLKSIVVSQGPGAVAGIIGPRAGNETLFLFQRFFRDLLKSNHIDHRTDRVARENDDGFITSLALGAANQPFAEIKTASVILLIGSDLPNELPILHLQIRERARKGAKVISTHFRPTRLDKICSTALRYRPGTEFAFVTALVHAVAEQKGIPLPPEFRSVDHPRDFHFLLNHCGVSENGFQELIQVLCSGERFTLLLGESAYAAPEGTEIVKTVAALCRLLSTSNDNSLPFSLLLPYANSRGAADMGCYPHRKPGYLPVDAPGKNTTQILQGCIDGSLQALFLFHTDLIEEYPERDLVQKALENVPFLVVADAYRFETAAFAEVFLPLSVYTEEDGTYTNLAGRVQRAEKALPQLPGTLAGYQVLLALGERWGADWQQIPPATVFEQIARSAAPYQGLSWETIGREGTQIPPVNPQILNTIPGEVDFSALAVETKTPGEFPIRWVRGKFLFDCSGEKRFAPALVQRSEPCRAEMHPQDAVAHGLQAGTPITLVGEKGSVTLPLVISTEAWSGHIIIVGGYDGVPLNGIVVAQAPWVKIQQ